MRMDKGAILASMIVIALASVFAGATTMAWFSTENVTTDAYTMDAGTMKMGITTGPYTFSNLAPGQVFGPITIKITNTGTIDIRYLCGNLVLLENQAFADKIEVTSIAEFIPGYGWQESIGGTQKYEELVQNYEAPLTLLELAKSYYGTEPSYPDGKTDQFGGSVKSLTDWVTGYGYDIVPEGEPALRVGGTYQMKLTFKFSEDAGNDLQGATCSFKIVFLGIQDLSQVP